jgi:hypothetical protein
MLVAKMTVEIVPAMNGRSMTHLLNASGSETAMGHPCRLSDRDVEADRPISTIQGPPTHLLVVPNLR